MKLIIFFFILPIALMFIAQIVGLFNGRRVDSTKVVSSITMMVIMIYIGTSVIGEMDSVLSSVNSTSPFDFLFNDIGFTHVSSSVVHNSEVFEVFSVNTPSSEGVNFNYSIEENYDDLFSTEDLNLEDI